MFFPRVSKSFSPLALFLFIIWGFPGGIVVKNLPTNTGDTRDGGLIPGLGILYYIPNLKRKSPLILNIAVYTCQSQNSNCLHPVPIPAGNRKFTL